MVRADVMDFSPNFLRNCLCSLIIISCLSRSFASNNSRTMAPKVVSKKAKDQGSLLSTPGAMKALLTVGVFSILMVRAKTTHFQKHLLRAGPLSRRAGHDAVHSLLRILRRIPRQ